MKRWIWMIAACSSSPAPKAPAPSAPVPMCAGQILAGATAARTGATELQLAPGLLDHMPTCTTPDPTPISGDAGAVNAKGDCEWPSGVKCHFHSGAEFVESGAPRPKAAELHCIFSSSEPKSPRVFGMHFTCKTGALGKEIHQGQACGAGLQTTLAAALPGCDARCCDAGTLTVTAEERKQAGTLDVRPDFRVCAKTAELDCSMFAGMIGHTANAPLFGAPIDEAF